MTVLVIGLVLFLGVHSSRFLAADFRARQIAARGERGWKGLYSIASAVGLVLIVWGYGQTRQNPVDLWNPPHFLFGITSLLMVLSFILLVAAYVPGTRIKARVRHPMTLGVKTWAFAHLLSNGRLGDVVLFGAILVWAVVTYINARKRDRAAGTVYPVGPVSKDVIAVVVGLVAAVVFAKWLHGPLIGVQPF
jgi:uncharacterized membrane protein